jgi:glycosyltransferase involved in cell wall biosynthesis
MTQPAAVLELSVVIPSYNSAPWLPTTFAALEAALARTSWSAEVIVVDDGSTDATGEVVAELAEHFPYPVRLVGQTNQGRFLARWNGVNEARAQRILLLDSRILLEPASLAHVEATAPDDSWNAHAVTDTSAPLVGLFWEVPTHVFWRSYLRDPRPTVITAANFESVPKGTTVFLVDRDVFLTACRDNWPAENARLTNDDTKLLRDIVDSSTVRLDPAMAVVYRPRTSVRAFVRHSYDRGTTLVDGFGGVSMRANLALVLLGVLPPLALVALIVLVVAGMWPIALALVLLGLLVVAAPAVVAARARCSARGIAAYLVYIWVFAGPYWLGVMRGLVLHRSVLVRTRQVPTV